MAWIGLLLAGAFEIVWAASKKASEGFTRPVWAVETSAGPILAGILGLWLTAQNGSGT